VEIMAAWAATRRTAAEVALVAWKYRRLSVTWGKTARARVRARVRVRVRVRLRVRVRVRVRVRGFGFGLGGWGHLGEEGAHDAPPSEPSTLLLARVADGEVHGHEPG